MAVVVRRFPGGAQRPLLLLTLVAGFASTIFLPVSGVLVERSGWRAALLALAAVLATATVVPHALALRGETAITPPASAEAVTSRALLRRRHVPVAHRRVRARDGRHRRDLRPPRRRPQRSRPPGGRCRRRGGRTGATVGDRARRPHARGAPLGVLDLDGRRLHRPGSGARRAGHDAGGSRRRRLRALLRGGVRRNDDRAADDRRHPVRRPLVRQHQRHAPRRGDRRQGRGATGGGCRRHPRRVLHARALDTRGRGRPRCRRHGPRCSRPPPGPRAANRRRAPTPVPRAPPAPPRSAPARPASRSSAPASHP